jgi:molecular chaperone GrpE
MSADRPLHGTVDPAAREASHPSAPAETEAPGREAAEQATSGREASGREPATDPAVAADAAAAYAAAASPADDDGVASRYFDAAVEADGPDGETPEAGAAETEQHEHHVVRDLEELAAKAEKADEYLELAQRTRADFENYRKIAARKVAEAQDRGIARLAKELLHAIDNLDRALQAAEAAAPAETPAAGGEAVPGGDSQLVSGIKLVHADVLAALARVGIEPFSPEGEPFDPQFHEAVAQTPVEGAVPGSVVEVYQRGYRLGETVLRPARVLVAG